MAGDVVLIVVDDAPLRTAIAMYLRSDGYRAIVAAGGREALARLEQGRARPDALVLDLALPDGAGYAVLDHLRRSGPHDLPILILIVSSSHPDASLLATLDAEERDFIAKPVDLDELRLRLRRLLRAEDGSSAPVQVYTLGTLRVYRAGALLFDESWRNKPAKSVFKLLLTTRGQRCPKETLAEALWPETETAVALNRLRVAVHDLRERLGDLTATGQQFRLIVQQEGAYILDPQLRCWTDAAAFEAAAQQGGEAVAQERFDAALAAYQRAEALYQGDYLGDDSFAEWSVAPRERLRDAFLTLLSDVARLQARRGDVAAAVRSCRRVLHAEPWREDVYRQMMHYLAAAGRRSEALRVYEECRRALAAEELDLSAATVRLRQRIVAPPHGAAETMGTAEGDEPG